MCLVLNSDQPPRWAHCFRRGAPQFGCTGLIQVVRLCVRYSPSSSGKFRHSWLDSRSVKVSPYSPIGELWMPEWLSLFTRCSVSHQSTALNLFQTRFPVVLQPRICFGEAAIVCRSANSLVCRLAILRGRPFASKRAYISPAALYTRCTRISY